MVVIKETKTTVKEIVGYDDYDRAFANNISCEFMTVTEYTNDCVESRLLPKGKQHVVKFSYNHSIIQPEVRELYADELDKKTNVNIFKELGTMPAANYLIIILGPPRSGKTTLTNELISKWRNSSYGDYNAVEVLYGSSAKRLINNYKKIIANRISVVLDGCDLSSINTYIKIAESHSAGVLAVIIDCGIEMAKVLNHVYVEESTNENATVIKLQDYCIYRSKFTAPNCKYIMYYPKIDRRDTVMKFRY
jgi:Cdc6-like AAA superfamily ATPase